MSKTLIPPWYGRLMHKNGVPFPLVNQQVSALIFLPERPGVKRCPSCGGMGVEHNPDYPPCHQCKGRGLVKEKKR